MMHGTTKLKPNPTYSSSIHTGTTTRISFVLLIYFIGTLLNSLIDLQKLSDPLTDVMTLNIQGGSNMTGIICM